MKTAFAPALLSLLLLGACEGAVTVEIQGDAPAADGVLTLALEQLTLTRVDGGTQTFDLDQTLRLDTDGPTPLRLLDGETIGEGEYTAFAVRINALDSRFDQDGAGPDAERVISGSTVTATTDNRRVRIREDESISITLHLAGLPSLPQPGIGEIEQVLRPQMDVARTDQSSPVTVTLDAPNALQTFCADVDPADKLPRLYVFTADDSTQNDDMDGIDDARRVVLVSSTSNGVRTWRLPRLPHDDYRLALSCDLDDPGRDESITFFCPVSTTVEGARTIVLDQDSPSLDCL